MNSARISSLLEPFLLEPLTNTQLGHISTYIDLLLRWNSRTNLTAVRDPEEIVTRHFGESLFAAQTLFPAAESNQKNLVILSEAKDPLSAGNPQSPSPGTNHVETAAPGRPAERSSAETPGTTTAHSTSPALVNPSDERNLLSPAPLDLLDLGSGAGFPGIPIHLWTPALRTTLIESQQKKVAFLREVIRSLTLTNIDVSPTRAEDFSSAAHTVTLRAVERFEQILPTAARLVAPQGRLALLIAEPQIQKAQTALPHFRWHPPIAIPTTASRVLLVGNSITTP